MFVALHGHLKAQLHDALNLGTGVDIGVVGLVVVLILLTEIHTAREFAQHYKVGTTDEFILQRRLMQETVESGHRTDVGKQTEFLTHGQQPRLRTHLCRRVVVVSQVAHSGKEHGIGLHTHLVSCIRIRVAYLVDGMSTTDGLVIRELVSTLGCDGIQHSHTLFHDLRTDTVARKNGNIQFHNSLLYSFSMMFNILKVALMAASVWSASRPRVRNSLPLSFQVMTVCTKASVRPPGGMVTA